jgi:hypothetical protein
MDGDARPQTRPVGKKKAARPLRRFEIAGHLDAHAVEALQLEIRRLALRYGVEITMFRVAPRERTIRGSSA